MKLYFTTALMVLLVGCGTASRVVRLDTGRAEPIVFVSRTASETAKLDEDEFEEAVASLAREARPSARPQEAARRLFEVDARSGSFTYETRSRQLTPREPDAHLLAATVPKLPGLRQAAVRAEAQLGIHLAAVGEVETVAVSPESVTIALALGAFTDAETGNTVHVSGDRVVITSRDGQIVTQFRNPRANTQSRIQSGRWVPRDE